MPWSVGDVEGFNKGLTDAEKERWLGAANGYLKTCLADGGTAETCEASAIKIANAAVKEAQHETNGLGEKILEAVFAEKASFRATLKGFFAAAKALVNMPGIPKKYKDQIAALNDTISTSQWAKLEGDDSGGTPEAVGASEAIREALQTIARKQVRTRLREVDLGGVSVSEFETKLNDALKGKLGTSSEFYLVDVYDDLLVFNDDDGMWGTPYKIGPDGSVALGKPVRVKRLCRYIPEEGTEKPPEDRGEQPGEQSLLPGDWWKYEDWWKYSQYWNTDGNKALGGGAPASSPSQGQEALREEGAIVEAATFTEDGAIVEEGGQNE
jgi:hypothetical protein